MNIKLPHFLIAELYRNTLIYTQEMLIAKDVHEIDKNPESNWYLGENRKGVVILVNEPNADFPASETLQLLTSILFACNLTLADAAIINFHKNTCNYQQLKEALQPQYIFLFNVTALQIQLPFTIPNYQVQPYDNCTLLLASSLTTMLANKQEKRNLWNCLKKIFNA